MIDDKLMEDSTYLAGLKTKREAVEFREQVQARKEGQWNQQHASFIAAYNSLLEAEDVVLQEWRAF